MPDIDAAREVALTLAVQLHAARERQPDPFETQPLPERVLDTAGHFANWLLARPHRLRLRAAPFTFTEGHAGPGVTTQFTHQGEHMSVTMTDDQSVSYVCQPEDDKGAAVTDTLTWSSDDNGAVVTVTPAADGLSCVFAAVAPGTANISVTDGNLSGGDQIIVTPGAVASLVLTPGSPAAE